MQQIAVAVLHVDEVEALLLGEVSGAAERGDDLVHVAVAEHRGVDHVSARVEVGVSLSHARSRIGPPAGVGELQADERLAPSRLPCGRDEGASEGTEGGRVRVVEEELTGIGSTFRTDRDRLTAPHPARARLSESSPASLDQLGRGAIPVGVPALHRLDDPTVCNGDATAELEWLGQRRTLGGAERPVVTRELETELVESGGQGVDATQALDAREANGSAHGQRPVKRASRRSLNAAIPSVRSLDVVARD